MPILGFSAYETIRMGFPNIHTGGYTFPAAKQLVTEGKMRWAWKQGGVLALVPKDYKLKEWESFLNEAPDGSLIQESQVR